MAQTTRREKCEGLVRFILSPNRSGAQQYVATEQYKANKCVDFTVFPDTPPAKEAPKPEMPANLKAQIAKSHDEAERCSWFIPSVDDVLSKKNAYSIAYTAYEGCLKKWRAYNYTRAKISIGAEPTKNTLANYEEETRRAAIKGLGDFFNSLRSESDRTPPPE